MTKQYHHVAIGGTFDHLHAGHRTLIDTAFLQAEKVSIGITDDSMAKKWNKKLFLTSIESYKERIHGVKTYLKNMKYIDRAELFPLTDIFGTTITDTTLDGIIVTEETLKNAHVINKTRIKNGISPLSIIVIPFLKGKSHNIIRSTQIRSGCTDREGSDYISLFKSTLQMPQTLRQTLSGPISTPLKGDTPTKTALLVIKKLAETQPVLSIAVGDIVNATLRDAGYIPDISLIDLRSGRQDVEKPLQFKNARKVANLPGSIQHEAVQLLHHVIQTVLKGIQPQQIIIQGEEDLMALPAILLAPLGSIVLYGQRDQGVVFIEINEAVKAHIYKLLKKFIII